MGFRPLADSGRPVEGPCSQKFSPLISKAMRHGDEIEIANRPFLWLYQVPLAGRKQPCEASEFGSFGEKQKAVLGR